ncbi:MAG TPA: putative Ig domain-containing protein [Steroidobacteraceae bacterium]|nr:putative Ig domain-containing protein [Steroidobacteraceae bacterium]
MFHRITVLLLLSLGLSVPAHAANQAPTISGTPNSWVYVGSPYSFKATGYDPEGAKLTYQIYNKPAWATFNTSTGVLSGTPMSVGLWNGIRVRVSDGTNTSPAIYFAIRATGRANVPPTISGAPATSVAPGSAYSFTPSTNDANGDPLRFTIAHKPGWLSFDQATGKLSGTPSASNIGTYTNIVISVTDGTPYVSLAPFSISVSGTGNRAPTISGTPPTSVTVGKTYTFQPVAADADKNTLGFSIQNKPVWATFSSATGQLSGTPTAAQIGTFANVTISVSDGKASAALAPFAISVSSAPNKVPTISGAPPTAVNAGSAYAFRPTAADGDGDTLTFTIANKPAWATFSSATGQLAGTPTSASAGTYANVVISVSDGKASVALAPFAITVADASSGAASLTWSPPTQNTDGTTLTNLAGYRIVYGVSATQLTQTIQVTNAGMSAYVVENLAPGTYYFAIRAYTASGAESTDSNVVAKVVQ